MVYLHAPLNCLRNQLTLSAIHFSLSDLLAHGKGSNLPLFLKANRSVISLLLFSSGGIQYGVLCVQVGVGYEAIFAHMGPSILVVFL